MFDECVWNADAFDARRIAVFTHKFGNGCTQSTDNGPILDGDDVRKSFSDVVQERFVKWFEKNHIIMSDRYAFFLGRLDRFDHFVAD